MPADASRHKRYSQHGASAKSSIHTGDFLPDRDFAQPALRKNSAFYSIIRRVVDEIMLALLDFDREPEARRRRRAELERHRFARPSPSYGCATIMVNQEACDVPTLAHESGRRIFGERNMDDDLQPPPYTC